MSFDQVCFWLEIFQNSTLSILGRRSMDRGLITLAFHPSHSRRMEVVWLRAFASPCPMFLAFLHAHHITGGTRSDISWPMFLAFLSPSMQPLTASRHLHESISHIPPSLFLPAPHSLHFQPLSFPLCLPLPFQSFYSSLCPSPLPILAFS